MTQTRRTYGSGSLRHLEGDRYRFECRADDGARLSRTFTARNRTEAEKTTGALRLELIAKHESRKDASGIERERRQEWTVERYADYYLEKWAPVHLANTTRRRYTGAIETNIKPNIGQMRMVDVTPTTLQELYAKLAGKGARQRGGDGALSGPSIWMVHNVIRAIFTFAIETQGDFTANPAAGKAARPNVPRTGNGRRAVDVAEVERFVALACEREPEIAVPVMLSAWLGTRRSETLALQWRDVDLHAAEITVRRSVTQTPGDDGPVVRETTKTGKVRTVPIDANTAARLKTTRTDQLERRLAFGRGWRGGNTADADWVCAQPDGSMIAPSRFESRFRLFAEREKVAITPHLLRHAFVSQLIAAGFDAVTISAITGHSPDVLLRVYAHAFDDRKREAIETLAQARAAVRAAR
ncbi:MAG: site-specific integrase [Actinobacteria bacterium]|nr:site-specific integrase [Actinomycetota bacterium]